MGTFISRTWGTLEHQIPLPEALGACRVRRIVIGDPAALGIRHGNRDSIVIGDPAAF
jgi:hypothetical protein